MSPFGSRRVQTAGRAVRASAMRALVVLNDPPYYNLERMLKAAAAHGVEIGCCGTCLDARGIRDDMLAEGAHRSTLEQLTDWTLWAEQTLVF